MRNYMEHSLSNYKETKVYTMIMIHAFKEKRNCSTDIRLRAPTMCQMRTLPLLYMLYFFRGGKSTGIHSLSTFQTRDRVFC
ncbi:unnamed protein product [Amaranthus hypochondriacus]